MWPAPPSSGYRYTSYGSVDMLKRLPLDERHNGVLRAWSPAMARRFLVAALRLPRQLDASLGFDPAVLRGDLAAEAAAAAAGRPVVRPNPGDIANALREYYAEGAGCDERDGAFDWASLGRDGAGLFRAPPEIAVLGGPVSLPAVPRLLVTSGEHAISELGPAARSRDEESDGGGDEMMAAVATGPPPPRVHLTGGQVVEVPKGPQEADLLRQLSAQGSAQGWGSGCQWGRTAPARPQGQGPLG